jgi:hypothetical protein
MISYFSNEGASSFPLPIYMLLASVLYEVNKKFWNLLPAFLTLFNKLSGLRRHDIAQHYWILYCVVQRLSQHNFKILYRRQI